MDPIFTGALVASTATIPILSCKRESIGIVEDRLQEVVYHALQQLLSTYGEARQRMVH